MNDPDEMKRRLLSTSIIIIFLFPRVRPSACSQFLLLGFTLGKIAMVPSQGRLWYKLRWRFKGPRQGNI